MAQTTRLTLMQRLKNRSDDKSWEEFNEAYRGFIYSILNRMQVEASLIDDLMQEIMLSVWKALPGFEYNPSKGRFSSWLATITINTVKSAQLKKSRLLAREQKVYDQQANLEEGDLEGMIEREWAEFLTKTAWENVSKNLSEVMRQCFEGFMDGKSLVKVAEDLSLPDNTVRVYKRRVNTMMKREIFRLGEFMD